MLPRAARNMAAAVLGQHDSMVMAEKAAGGMRPVAELKHLRLLAHALIVGIHPVLALIVDAYCGH